ncbi:MAG: hypothetical protein QOG48_2453 [Verrucomicrobiota bacterium]|jgi:hypothetical protein
MHELGLRNFFDGGADANELREDLVDSIESTEGVRRYRIVDMAEPFQITTTHLIQLCDAVLANSIMAADLQAIGFCIVASDKFEWAYNTPEGDIIAETVHDWSSPETNYPLTETTVRLFRERFVTGEDVLKKRLLS